ncbi:hypothetical protein GGX14DRAFT_571921 [Mycena pura]|uniref:F-box domain-containing protein n=1 Tax=Mycena pura TaxID=153505 RepID=A0AAD6V607_9AGAR|nr:hypothetical protein GGX14DRAFT_571921 [Mycena pura]
MISNACEDPPSSYSFPSTEIMSHIRTLLRSNGNAPENLGSVIDGLSIQLEQHAAQIKRYDAYMEHPAEEMSRLEDLCAKAELERDATQKHLTECLSLRSPVRRLPAEILAHIFALCAPEGSVKGSQLTPTAVLAHIYLLQLAEVCAWWQDIVYGTPALWSTIKLRPMQWYFGERRTFRKVLDHSAGHALDLTINGHMPPLIIQELVSHSARWRTVDLTIPVCDIRHLSAIRGRLPVLENLTLRKCKSDDADSDDLKIEAGQGTIDLFKNTPTLKCIIVEGCFIPMFSFPIKQILYFECIHFPLSNIAMAFSIMTDISPGTSFRLRMICDIAAQGLEIPSVVSRIGNLSLEARNAHPFGEIFEQVTLPSLHELNFPWSASADFLSFWPHTQFLALAARSSFSENLVSLHLIHVVITEGELLETLSALACLERLSISDQQRLRRSGVDHHLITDSFFITLTRRTTALIPALRSIHLQSRLEFDDRVFLDFVLSRIRILETSERKYAKFEVAIRWLRGRERALAPDILARVDELRAQRKLAFSMKVMELTGTFGVSLRLR